MEPAAGGFDAQAAIARLLAVPNWSSETIQGIAQALFAHASAELMREAADGGGGVGGLPDHLNKMLCGGQLAGTKGGAAGVLESLAQGSDHVRCGRVFQANEIVHRCRSCGIDPTCVMCHRCFNPADHAGHEVMFYCSSGRGGCCDGGDPEAWRQSAPQALRGLKKQTTDGPELEPAMASTAVLLFAEIFDWCLAVVADQHKALADPRQEPPPAGDLMQAEFVVRESAPAASRSSPPPPPPRSLARTHTRTLPALVCCRDGLTVAGLHNNDVHTFEAVIKAVQQHCKHSRGAAQRLTTEVHNAGSATVLVGNFADCAEATVSFRELGLCVSLAPAAANIRVRSQVSAALIGEKTPSPLMRRALGCCFAGIARADREWVSCRLDAQELPGIEEAGCSGS